MTFDWSQSGVSRGYARGKAPELVTLRNLAEPPIEAHAASRLPHVETLLVPAMSLAEARGSGYTGSQCSHCNSMRMKVSGHCEVCDDCGTTTGCS